MVLLLQSRFWQCQAKNVHADYPTSRYSKDLLVAQIFCLQKIVCMKLSTPLAVIKFCVYCWLFCIIQPGTFRLKVDKVFMYCIGLTIWSTSVIPPCAQFCCKMWRGSLVWNQYITKPKEKNMGDMSYYIPTVWKSGGTRPPCLPPNCAHAYHQVNSVGHLCANFCRRYALNTVFIRLLAALD